MAMKSPCVDIFQKWLHILWGTVLETNKQNKTKKERMVGDGLKYGGALRVCPYHLFRHLENTSASSVFSLLAPVL